MAPSASLEVLLFRYKDGLKDGIGTFAVFKDIVDTSLWRSA